MSGEHIIRKKILSLFDVRDRRTTSTRGYTLPDGTFAYAQRHDIPDAYNQTVNRVCKQYCNEGWMNSEIEVPAEVVLFPLIQGEAKSLSLADTRHLANWAYKTALVRALTEPKEVPIVEAQLYTDYYNSRKPPINSRIYIAKTEHSDWPYTKFRGAICIRHRDNQLCHAWVISIIIGAAAFYVAFDSHDFDFIGTEILALGAHATQIWPASILQKAFEPRYIPRSQAEAMGNIPQNDLPLHPSLRRSP